jgi:hypothetical protein
MTTVTANSETSRIGHMMGPPFSKRSMGDNPRRKAKGGEISI